MMRVLLACCLFFLCGSFSYAQESLVKSTLNEKTTATSTLKNMQASINTLSAKQADLLADYRVTLQQLERTNIYNDHLQTVVSDQDAQKTSMSTQLKNFANVEQDIVPLMLSMITSLEKFVELDTPFQLDERRARVQKLKALMDSSEVAVSEKYRRIMEAYKIETDFGYTTEHYVGWLGEGDARREVDFVRVGRVVLAYQTHDRSETGFYNPETKKIEVLPDSYRDSVWQALKFARKEAPPSLLKLPVAAPGDVK